MKPLKRITGLLLLIGAMIFIGIPMLPYLLIFKGATAYSDFMDRLMFPIIRMMD